MSLPTAPTGLTATANANDTVSLSWSANPANQKVTAYNVYREAYGSTAATLIATVSGTSYTDAASALTPGSRWTYYLEAVNAAGTSPPSATVSVTIPLPLPSAPTGLTATANANDTVSLSRTANPAGQQVSAYTVYREPYGSSSATPLATVSGTSYTDAGGALTPGSQWTYSVEAVNATGASPPSAPVSVTIPKGQILLPPAAPSGLAATANSNDTVSLSWTANAASDAVIEYRIYRTPAIWFMPKSVAAVAGTSYTDASGELLPNTQWYYFIVAVNAAGISPPSASVGVTIPQPLSAPTAPSGLTATANSNDTVSLSWTANPASQQVTGYNVYREQAGSTAATLLATVAGTSYTDSSSVLTAGSSWAYYLEAVNAAGTSPPSSTATVTMPAAGTGTQITTVRIANTGATPVAAPLYTFATPFPPGAIPATSMVQLRKSDGTTVVSTQQDQESTWLQDGSWKTVAISAAIPDTFGADTFTFSSYNSSTGLVTLTLANPSTNHLVSGAAVISGLPDPFDGVQTITVSGSSVTYTVATGLTAPAAGAAGTIGQLFTYQIWSVSGSPSRTANVTLAQLTANTDIKFLFTGYDLGADTFEVSVNDIVAHGTQWPWTAPQVTTTGTITNGSTTLTVASATGIQVGQVILASQGLAPNTYVTAVSGTSVTMSQQAYASASNINIGFLNPPMQGWEVIRSGPVCTEWRFWSVFKRVSDGAFHYWLRGVIFVRAWGATGPFEIGGYWGIFNAFGPNLGGSVGASATKINKYAFTARLQNGNTVLANWGGPGDFRATTVAQTAINTANNTVALTAAQAQALLGVGYFQYENHPAMGVPVVLSSSGTMPGGLSAGTPYWITSTNPPAISFCPTRLDAEQATNIIAITSQGSGTLSITPVSAAFPWVPTLALDQDGGRVWYAGSSGMTKPTLLVAHDFTYLTTRSRFLPPYLTNLTVDSTVSPPALLPFSQGALYFPSNIGGTGESEQDDRIGYLTWHSACALYRPFDLNLHRLNVGVALSYFEYSMIAINDYTTTLPVVNVTYYPNYGIPVGPQARWGYNGYSGWTMWSNATIDNPAWIDNGGAHNPCPAMLPYLHSGDFLYYELLALQCNLRMMGSYYGEITAGNVTCYKAWSVMNGGQGGTASSSWYTTPDWDIGDGAQVRGIAWLMRIHGVMMHFMPANRPEAPYLRDQTYGIASIPNQLVQYIPSSIGALGVYGGLNNASTPGAYYGFNFFQHYMMFLCWAMEAWKGEYPQLVNFVTNYLSRVVVGFGNEAWGGSPQGCIFGMNLYEPVAADPNGNYVSSWDQLLNWTSTYSFQMLNFTDLCSITQGGTTITLVNGIAHLYNIGVAPGWFVQTINFNDFPEYTIVTAQSGNQLTTGPAPGTSGNAQAAATRGVYTATTSAASAAGTTTLTFSSSSFPSGVVVGMGVQDVTNPTAIPIGGGGNSYLPYYVTAITSSGGTTTVTLSRPIGIQNGGSVAAGDTIRFGTVVTVSSLPIPWPGIATLISQSGLKDMICLDGGAEYVNQDSYICMVTSGLGVASVLYNLNGSPALANAVNIYNEIRRRQYLGTYNPPLSFANGPKWAIGPIGATQ